MNQTFQALRVVSLLFLGAAWLNAATFTQTDNFAGSGDFTRTATFQKFGSSVGGGFTLTNVTIQFVPQFALSDMVSNGTSIYQSYQVTFSQSASFYDGSLTATGAVSYGFGPVTYALSNGATRPLSSSYSNVTNSISSSTQPSLLTMFSGNGATNLFITTATSTSLSSGVSLITNNPAVSGTLTVIYTYK